MRTLTVIVFLLGLSSSAFAVTYDCTTYQLPAGNTVRQAGGINGAGTVSGSYTDTTGAIHGFFYDPSTGNFLSVDYPGASQISLFNINNNVAVGQAFLSSGAAFFTVDSSGNFHLIPIAAGYTISSAGSGSVSFHVRGRHRYRTNMAAYGTRAMMQKATPGILSFRPFLDGS
jgi:hypothetical protein